MCLGCLWLEPACGHALRNEIDESTGLNAGVNDKCKRFAL